MSFRARAGGVGCAALMLVVGAMASVLPVTIARAAASATSATTTTTTTTSTTTASTITTSTASGTAPAPVAATGHMRLAFGSVHGRFPFALTREAIEVQGTVVPYVAGQRVRVVFYSDGREFAARTAVVGPHGKGTGVFRATVSSAPVGRVRAIASHVATPQLEELQSGTEDMTVLSPPYLTIGASGAAVWVLQRTLAALHYAVPQSGYFDEATADAVVAFRKLTNLPRVGYADVSVFHALKRGEGAFHVRYPRQGSHVEADLTYQVLAEIEPGGRVRDIYPTSSGKPSTPTVLGQFSVYEKTPGENSEEMLDANYFIRGYAIHGYPEVPTYAASHGCLRVPNLDAASIYGWVQVGTPVDVYYASYGS